LVTLWTLGPISASSCSLHLELFAACVANHRFHKTHHTLSVVLYFILWMFYLAMYYPKDFLLCGRALNTGCLHSEKMFCYPGS